MLRKLIAIVMISVAAGASPSATTLIPGVTSRLILEGSSNVTDWRCTGTSLEGEMSVAAPLDKINAVIDRIEDGNIAVWMANPAEGRFAQPRFRMRIPIANFRCGNRVMERDMSQALKADRHPVIDFEFTELRGNVNHDLDAQNYQAKIAGQLMLAGASREVEVLVRAERIAPDQFRIRAELPVRMTDFGIRPPTALFGMVKAKDELLVRFDLTLKAAS
jgi:hypothetical protein